MKLRLIRVGIAVCTIWFATPGMVSAQNPTNTRPFRISVRDAETGRGVPLVELTMTNGDVFVTDNAGMIAFNEPGFMNTRVHFRISSHGYEYPKDGFGIQGKACNVTPGGSAALDIHRINIAERLYRVTGSGLYRDSVLLGDEPPITQPLLNGLVTGQDSVQSIVYNGTIRWFWGDTNRPAYPLGNFHTSGAVSELPPPHGNGLDPSLGINLDYFVDSRGFSRPMIPMQNKPGPVWVDGLMVVFDRATGREHLFCHWTRMKSLGEIYERGLALYNDDNDVFEPIRSIAVDSRVHPYGHPVELTLDGDRVYAFGSPLPCMYVPATLDAVRDPSTYRSFTPFVEGTDAEGAHEIQREADGRIRYGWKAATKPLEMRDVAALEQAGAIEHAERWFDLRDVETGEDIHVHGGSVAWNPYRNKWIAIVLQSFGEPSFLGEIWYAEADTPLGPWVWARRIVTHDRYSFYNPKHHSFLDQDGGRLIYFEGTYTKMFSATKTATPRYDYNQIMYCLSLDDPQLHLPAPLYVTSDGRLTMRDGIDGGASNGRAADVAFFAVGAGDETEALVPVYGGFVNGAFTLSMKASERFDAPLFYAYPADAKSDERPEILVPLYEFSILEEDKRQWSTRDDLGKRWQRADEPLCYVWENRIGKEVVTPLVNEGLRFKPHTRAAER